MVGGTLPTITKQPTGGTIAWGATTNLAVKVTGSPTPTVQWQSSTDNVSFTNISGATSTTLTVPGDLAHWSTKWYRAVVTNGVGAVTSSAVSVTVNASAPVITVQPTGGSVAWGSSTNLSITASGSPTPTVQWQSSTDNVSFTNISGATSTTLTVPGDLAHSVTKWYRAVVINGVGAVTSSAVSVTVSGQPPSITAQPTGGSVNWGSNLNLNVAASNSTGVQWQWSTDNVNFTNISGATSTTLSVPGDLAHWSTKWYRAVVTNGVGAVTSSAVSVTVIASAPVITTQPTGGTANWGLTRKLKVKATGSPTPTVQWQSSDDHVSFANISGATSTTLTVPGDLAHWSTKWYRAVVTNGIGAVTSTAVSVTVIASAPVITVQPVSVSQKVGKKVSLKVKAVGTPTPTYQWMKYRNGAWISVVGGVASKLTLTPASITTDRYRVVISNPIGSVTSSSVNVTTTP